MAPQMASTPRRSCRARGRSPDARALPPRRSSGDRRTRRPRAGPRMRRQTRTVSIVPSGRWRRTESTIASDRRVLPSDGAGFSQRPNIAGHPASAGLRVPAPLITRRFLSRGGRFGARSLHAGVPEPRDFRRFSHVVRVRDTTARDEPVLGWRGQGRIGGTTGRRGTGSARRRPAGERRGSRRRRSWRGRQQRQPGECGGASGSSHAGYRGSVQRGAEVAVPAVSRARRAPEVSGDGGRGPAPGTRR
jgi:hypothetical protein